MVIVIMVIKSIKDNDVDKSLAITKIYLLTKDLEKKYPNYKEWFLNKQVPESLNSIRRNIFFSIDGNKVTGVSCVKNYDDEKKLCTLFVDKDYRNCGIGDELIKKSIEFLGCSKPILTINSQEVKEFKNIIKKYNWNITDSISNLYNPGESEIIFNGKSDIKKRGL